MDTFEQAPATTLGDGLDAGGATILVPLYRPIEPAQEKQAHQPQVDPAMNLTRLLRRPQQDAPVLFVFAPLLAVADPNFLLNLTVYPDIGIAAIKLRRIETSRDGDADAERAVEWRARRRLGGEGSYQPP